MTESLPPAQPRRGLLRSSAVVGLMTMVSRVLGLARDMTLAIFVGATGNADAFFVAFKVPQFLRRLFAEGAFSQAFVPVLSEYRSNRTHAEVRDLVDRVAGSLGGSLLLVTGVVAAAAPLFVYVVAPGFSGNEEKFALAGSLLRITFPYLMLISLTGFAGAMLNSYGRFAVPAFTPVWLNLSLIVAAVWVSPSLEEPTYALAWGVFIAGLLQLLFQIPSLYRLDLMPRPRWDWGHEGVRRVLKLMVPAIFGVSVSQINLLLDTILASFLPTGSVSWLYFSDRIAELPLGVFAIAVSTVILPSLSRDYAARSQGEFNQTMNWAVRLVMLVAIPATVALVVMAETMLVALFQYREFTARDVTMAGWSMRAYSLGLVAFMLIKVLAPGFFSRQDTATPVKIGIIAMVTNMVLNLALVIPLHMFWQVGHVGLALATSLAAYLNAGLLWRGLRREGVFAAERRLWLELGRQLLAATLMGVVLWRLSPSAVAMADFPWWERAARLLAICAAGATVYFLCLWSLGSRLRHYRV